MAPTMKEDDFVQAVVVLDGFDGVDGLEPLTVDGRPKILLPVVNCPLIEYILELLHSSSVVHEVLLYCTSNVDVIKKYLGHSRWMSENGESKMKISFVVSESCFSIGDALRDIYDKRLVRNDFILLSGDVVSNAQLKNILDEHKGRRKNDKTTLMTMLYKRAAPGRGVFQAEPRTIVAFNAKTNRLLHHQISSDSRRKIAVPLSVFQEHDVVTVCSDILDCRISICSPEVLSLFQDNFDYQTRNDFIKGILEHEEILGNMIYLHFLEDEYAASVTNFLSYKAVSHDIINRWVFPIVPDQFAYEKRERYVHLRFNVYRHKDVTVERSSRLEEDVVVGCGSKIGNQTVISGSVIGRNCRIGDNVVLRDAFLWDDVVVGDGCTVDTAILASGVTLKANCRVTKSVITYDMNVDAGAILADIVLSPKSNEEHNISDSENEDGPKKRLDSESGESDNERKSGSDPWRSCRNQVYHYESSDSGSTDGEELGDMENLYAMDDTKVFFGEVLDTLMRGIEEKLKCDNLVLEINGLKYAYNVTISEVNFVVTKAILEIPRKSNKPVDDSAKLLVHLKELFTRFLPVVKNYIKSGESQGDSLNAIKEFAVTNDYFRPVLMKVLHFLYESDVLQEDSIVTWFDNLDSTDDGDKTVQQKVTPFIKWLQEAEEESD